MRDVGNTWHLKETLRRESLLNEHRDVDLLVDKKIIYIQL